MILITTLSQPPFNLAVSSDVRHFEFIKTHEEDTGETEAAISFQDILMFC